MSPLSRIAAFALLFTAIANAQSGRTDILSDDTVAVKHYGNDAPWYEKNIPFFDCSDPKLTEVYYYRWQLFKSHFRDIGNQGYIVTEFLNDVTWSIPPYQSLNDATAFHIHEGRWLNDPQYVDDYIDYMYSGGGDNRHFSEGITDAVYANYLVDGNREFVTKHLDSMQHIFNLWSDHYDLAKDLYFIEPILDATEYTISSIDASGGKDGFNGGQAFRPTINSFMYGNAVAISKIAALAGQQSTASAFDKTAEDIKQNVESKLWNDQFGQFVDRFKANNRAVHYWDFIRGRELAGYAPWYFNLPDNDPKYSASWQYALAPDKLGGPFGLRTVEPSYQYYMVQYRYDKPTGKMECQWNGATWPFDTTMVLGGMANLLNNYTQNTVHTSDYLRLLRQYANQHYLNGHLDLQEDYNPDTGGVIVGLDRSHHYNHSGFNDLIISGLAGLRPRPDDTLEVNPLIPDAADTIQYFCLENVHYHGQWVTIVYDKDGKHYGKGAGFSVYVNGNQKLAPSPLGKKTIKIGSPAIEKPQLNPINLAVNLRKFGFPTPEASINNTPDALYQALDGRVWFYPEMKNYWTTEGSQSSEDWYSIDLGAEKPVSSVKLYFYSDGSQFQPPTSFSVQSWNGQTWSDITGATNSPVAPIANGENTITFKSTNISKLRVLMGHPQKAAVALVELKAY